MNIIHQSCIVIAFASLAACIAPDDGAADLDTDTSELAAATCETATPNDSLDMSTYATATSTGFPTGSSACPGERLVRLTNSGLYSSYQLSTYDAQALPTTPTECGETSVSMTPFYLHYVPGDSLLRWTEGAQVTSTAYWGSYLDPVTHHLTSGCVLPAATVAGQPAIEVRVAASSVSAYGAHPAVTVSYSR